MQYRINKHKSLWRKAYLKTAGVSVLALTLVLQPFGGVVNGLQTVEYTEAPFSESELALWVTDRSVPSGGKEIVEYGGRTDVLALGVDANKRSTSNPHHYTEGIKKEIPASGSIKADLFVDADWQNKQVRAGLWGVAEDNSGGVSAYPIVEFASIEGNHIGWRVWDGVLGGWNNLSEPISWDTWVTLSLSLDKTDGSFDVLIDGSLVATNSQSPSNVSIGSVILNSYNFGVGTENYTVHWSKFAYGNTVDISAVPTNIRFANPSLACGAATKNYTITPMWDSADGAIKYQYAVVTPKRSSSNPWITTVNANSYNGAFTDGEGTYTFKVRGISADNRYSEWSESCSVTYDNTAPTTPTQLTPVNRGFSKVNDFYFDWTDSVDATALTYEFQSSQNPVTDAGVLTTGVWNNILHGNAEQKHLTDSKIRSVGANGTWYWQVRAIDAGGNKSAWSPTWKLTIDMQKPVANITYPAQGQYVRTFNVGNVLSVKGLVTDANPNYAHVQLLNNMNGSIVLKTIYGAFSSGSELTTFDTTSLADGKYGLNISAADGAGNVYNLQSETGAYRTFFIDNTRPIVTVNTPNNAVNPEKISVTATDNMRLKLVTANTYNESSTLVRSCSKNVESLALSEYTLDTCSTAGLPDGIYSIKTNALDAAGTISQTVTSYKFIIDTTVPAVNAEDFGVGSWTLASDGFTGINVGFNIRDFGSVSDINVTVERATGEKVSVDATQALIDKINDDNLLQLSAPIAVNGVINDTWCNAGACWTSPVATWNEQTVPQRTVITVVGTNTRGEPVTKTAENTVFSQAGGTFSVILPQQQAIDEDETVQTPFVNVPSVQGVSTSTPSATGGTRQGGGSSFAFANLQGGSFAREFASTRGNSPQPADVVLPPVSESGVLAAETSVDEDLMYASGINDEEEAGGKYMQYWWVPLVSIAAIAGVWALVASRRKRHDDQ